MKNTDDRRIDPERPWKSGDGAASAFSSAFSSAFGAAFGKPKKKEELKPKKVASK